MTQAEIKLLCHVEPEVFAVYEGMANALDAAEKDLDALRSALQGVDQVVVAGLVKERDDLRAAMGMIYQYLGAMDAPEWMLDNVSALANHEVAPHEWQAWDGDGKARL